MSRIFLGIDLGTTNSEIAALVDDPRRAGDLFRPVVHVPIEQVRRTGEVARSPVVPSVIRVEGPGKWTVGLGARDALHEGGLEPDRHVLSSKKSSMGLELSWPAVPEPSLRTPAGFSAALLRFLREGAEKHFGGADLSGEPAVITVPACFNPAQRRDTLEAARAAGLRVEEGSLLDEPNAAFLSFLNGPEASAVLDLDRRRTVMVVDFGGGTCDVSILSVERDPDRPLGLEIANLGLSRFERLGGDNVDWMIAKKILLPRLLEQNGRSAADLPGRRRDAMIRSLMPVAERLKIGLSDAARAGRAAWRSEAFASLTASAVAPTVLCGTDELDFDENPVSVAGSEFSPILEAFLDVMCRHDRVFDESGPFDRQASIFGPIWDAIGKSGQKWNAADAILLVGGMTRLPAVREHLATQFPSSRIIDSIDAHLAVSEGAALQAFHGSRPGAPSLVAPILAESLSILTRGGEARELIPATAPVPWPESGEPAELELIVPSEGLERVEIALASGREKRIVGTEWLEFQAPCARGEAIRLQFSVDRNKEVRLTAALAVGGESSVEVRLSNPASIVPDTPYRRDAARLEREIEEARAPREPRTGRRPLAWLLCQLAALHYSNDRWQPAFDAIREALQMEPGNPELLNMASLCYEAAGFRDRALALAERAARQDPEDATIQCNLGCLLAESGEAERAKACLYRALELSPDGPRPYVALGDLYFMLGDLRKHTECFEMALRLLQQGLRGRPGDLRHLRWLEYVARGLGRQDLAGECREAIERRKRNELLRGDLDALPEIAGELRCEEASPIPLGSEAAPAAEDEEEES